MMTAGLGLPDEMPTIGELRATGNEPRVHGNGFVQMDLSDTVRLHVWGDPRTPRQTQPTPIHDHVFGFTSRIFRGRLVNLPYEIVPTNEVGTYHVYTCVPRVRDDTGLVRDSNSPVPVYARPCYPNVVSAYGSGGEFYCFPAYQFHETFTPDGVAVTVIVKHGPTMRQDPHVDRRPRVLVPVGRQPDNDFDRHSFDPALLWRIIEDAVR